MSSEEVCRFFLTGSCRHGAACRFAHPGTGTGTGTSSSTVPATTTTTTTTTRETRAFDAGAWRECERLATAASSGCAHGDGYRDSRGDGGSEGRGVDGVGVGGGMRAGATAFRPGGGMRAGATAFRPGGGGGAWTNGPPMRVGGGEEDVVEEEWGYVDELGNWVAFADECDEGANEFLAAQLPDEDEFLGMTSEGPTGEDSWGYFDEKGNWVSLEGDASAYLATQDMVR